MSLHRYAPSAYVAQVAAEMNVNREIINAASGLGNEISSMRASKATPWRWHSTPRGLAWLAQIWTDFDED